MKDLKELQEKSTIENIQLEIETGLADLAQKMQKFNDEVADWDDDNQKVHFIPGSLYEDGHCIRRRSLKSGVRRRPWNIMDQRTPDCSGQGILSLGATKL